MSIMGIRASSQEIRYAILSKDESGSIVFENLANENRLKYPANIEDIGGKINWVKSEIDRIIRKNDGIERIVIKMNEYSRNENSAKRDTTYMDAIVMLCAVEKGIPFSRKLNSQIGSTASKAKELAENRVGRTQNYWNNTIADAILAAYWEIK